MSDKICRATVCRFMWLCHSLFGDRLGKWLSPLFSVDSPNIVGWLLAWLVVSTDRVQWAEPWRWLYLLRDSGHLRAWKLSPSSDSLRELSNRFGPFWKPGDWYISKCCELRDAGCYRIINLLPKTDSTCIRKWWCRFEGDENVLPARWRKYIYRKSF